MPYTQRQVAYDAIREAVARGERAFVVCALVEESTSAEAKAAKREAERLEREVFPELRIGLLTGRMKSAEKQSVMDRFRDGELDVLVATTVIEVGTSTSSSPSRNRSITESSRLTSCAPVKSDAQLQKVSRWRSTPHLAALAPRRSTPRPGRTPTKARSPRATASRMAS